MKIEERKVWVCDCGCGTEEDFDTKGNPRPEGWLIIALRDNGIVVRKDLAPACAHQYLPSDFMASLEDELRGV